MNNEKPISDVEALRIERERLDREQDFLLEQLKSDPNNEDARKELIYTLEQIEAIDGEENKNINAILQKLNIRTNSELLPEEGNPIEFDAKRTLELTKEGVINRIDAIEEEINNLLLSLPKARRVDFETAKNSLGAKKDQPTKISSEEIADLLDEYRLLLQRIRIEIENE